MKIQLPSPMESGASWDSLAAHLLSVEKTASWRSTHPSFSSWVADFAQSLKRSEATVWRVLASGRFYTELKDGLQTGDVTIPPLGSPAFTATPEALELAQKISRVAPAEVAQQILKKVVQGAISRRELRTYWETYRPVLDGKTARGRNVAAPRFNPRSGEMISSRMEADCIAGLIQDGPNWLGTAQAHLYRVMPISIDIASQLGVGCVPDVIVLYQSSPSSALEVHGIEITARLDSNLASRCYQSQGLGVDYFWIAAPNMTEFRLGDVGSEVGVLEADTQRVRVVRSAGPAKQDRDEALKLMRGLLTREVAA